MDGAAGRFAMKKKRLNGRRTTPRKPQGVRRPKMAMLRPQMATPQPLRARRRP